MVNQAMFPNITSSLENSRLNALTAYCSTILNNLRGNELDAALAGEVKRHGRLDAALRQHALDNIHPDDLVDALVRRGYTLASFGIQSIQLVIL